MHGQGGRQRLGTELAYREFREQQRSRSLLSLVPWFLPVVR
jgi:hypothetical protein